MRSRPSWAKDNFVLRIKGVLVYAISVVFVVLPSHVYACKHMCICIYIHILFSRSSNRALSFFACVFFISFCSLRRLCLFTCEFPALCSLPPSLPCATHSHSLSFSVRMSLMVHLLKMGIRSGLRYVWRLCACMPASVCACLFQMVIVYPPYRTVDDAFLLSMLMPISYLFFFYLPACVLYQSQGGL